MMVDKLEHTLPVFKALSNSYFCNEMQLNNLKENAACLNNKYRKKYIY